LLDGRVEQVNPGSGRLLVADPDTAALNSTLVAAGIRVTGITAERRSLEDVVLSVTGAGTDRFGADRPADRPEPPGPDWSGRGGADAAASGPAASGSGVLSPPDSATDDIVEQ
jgi:hypothetical protein